jgi:DNA primase
VISSYQAGIGNAVAIKGSALTEGHVHLIKRFAERVIFALDSDLAGDAAARRGIEIADRAGLDMRVSTMPSGKDPDDAAREDPVAFKKALAAATPIYDYFLASALKRFDVTSSWGKKKIADELVPTIAKIDNSIVQGHYINLLAQALRVSETVVTESIKKAQRLQYVVPQRDKKDALVKTQSRREKLELQLLAFLLQGKTQEWFEEFAGLISPSDISYPAVAALIERLDAFLAQHPVFLMKDFADMVPPELTPVLEEALLTDFSDSIDNEELAAREWTETLSEYHKLLLRTQIQTQTKYLAEQEQAGASEAQLSKIQQEITRLSLAYKQLEK